VDIVQHPKDDPARTRNKFTIYEDQNWEKTLTIAEAASILNIPSFDIYEAVMAGCLRLSSPGRVRWIEVQGWLHNKWANETITSTTPLWAINLLRNGHGLIQDVWTQEQIALITQQAHDYIDGERKEEINPRYVYTEKTKRGEVVFERLSNLLSTDLTWVLGHPIFDHISEVIFGTTDWVPFGYQVLYKVPLGIWTDSHRDIYWCLPEEYHHVRFLCQIQLTPTADSDGGIIYKPGTHRLSDDLTMVHCNKGNLDGFIPFEGQGIYDMNLHNVGVLHAIRANNKTHVGKRAYIGICPAEYIRMVEYYSTKTVELGKKLVKNAKEAYAKLF
jgi:hypothetical protein